MRLTSGQRKGLIALAIVSFFGPNALFLYYSLFRWSDMLAGLTHPIGMALLAEAGLVMVLGAVVLARRPMGRYGWRTFVALSLFGGLGFAIACTLLLNDGKRGE